MEVGSLFHRPIKSLCSCDFPSGEIKNFTILTAVNKKGPIKKEFVQLAELYGRRKALSLRLIIKQTLTLCARQLFLHFPRTVCCHTYNKCLLCREALFPNDLGYCQGLTEREGMHTIAHTMQGSWTYILYGNASPFLLHVCRLSTIFTPAARSQPRDLPSCHQPWANNTQGNRLGVCDPMKAAPRNQ